MKAIAAHRHVEFVVSQNYVLNPNGQYADIVLPVTTPWEKYADPGHGQSRNPCFIQPGHAAAFRGAG